MRRFAMGVSTGLVWLGAGWLSGCGGGPTPRVEGTEAAEGAGQADVAVPAVVVSEASKPKLPPCPQDDEGCRADRLGEITMGPLSTGLTVEEVVALFGEPASRQELIEEGATGLWVSEWEWPTRGVSVQMAGTTEVGPMTVNSFTVTAPFAEATDRGVKLGDPVAKVAAAYGDTYDKLGSREGELYVAGSLFGGILFNLDQGKVTRIFVGAASE